MSNIKLHTTDNTLHTVEFTTFSDNTETCTLPLTIAGTDVTVRCTLEDATRDLVRLALVKDALDRIGVSMVSLDLRYMPQARADRTFALGQPHALKVFANILNSLKFDSVYLEDTHSDVTEALVDNVIIRSQGELLQSFKDIISYDFHEEFTLCAPDLGAAKKMFDVARRLGHTEYIQAVKIRDTATGDIVKCDVVGEVTAKNVLIVDDICDGGASFIYLARKLRELGVESIGLYVTHGIFSKGLAPLVNDIDFIYCPNLVGKYVTHEEILKFNE